MTWGSWGGPKRPSRCKLATGEEVELLLGGTQLHVGVDGDRVVALDERVEQLMQPDGLLVLVALGEVLSREHLGGWWVPHNRMICSNVSALAIRC